MNYNLRVSVRKQLVCVQIDFPLDQMVDEYPVFLTDGIRDDIEYQVSKYMELLKTQKELGSVKWFDDKKGFGFLSTNTGDLFVHWRGIAGGDEYKTLEAGQRVRFFRRPGVNNEPEAFDVEFTPQLAPESTVG